jgi:dihydropteroate synthase
MGGADEVFRVLRGFGLSADEAASTVERERRAAVLVEGVDGPQRGALRSVAARVGISFHEGERADAAALLTGPVVLLREAARELPTELGAPLDDAVRSWLGESPRPLLRYRGGALALDAPQVMGVLNVTPDSFSDGGRFLATDDAAAQAERMLEDGAAIVDVGGESTRPGAEPVPEHEELRRVLPVVERLAGAGALVSIDTRRPEVARRAVEVGASIINDVEGLRAPAMREVAAATGAGVVIMHMRGEPRTMQREPHYEDVVAEVDAWLDRQARLAEAAGVPRDHIAVDPGIGFGKRIEHTLALLRHLQPLVSRGRPVLVGLSRKSFLGKVVAATPREDRSLRTPDARLAAGLALTCAAVAAGAAIVRTHDVRDTIDALRALRALQTLGRRPLPRSD